MIFIDQYYTKDGRLYRKIDHQIMGWLCNDRYLVFDHDQKKYLVHRAIFLLTKSYLPDLIDHIDRDKLNNHPDNLRESDKRLNAFNSGLRKDNTSGYKGVSFSKSNNKWWAYIWLYGKRISGGYHNKIDDAIDARLQLEKEYV